MAELTFENFLDAKVEWNDAIQESLDNHIFLTWEWLSTWWKHYGHKREFALTAINENGKIVVAAPLMRSMYRLYGLGLRKTEFIGTPASDYHTFLLRHDRPEYVRMILQQLSTNDAEWDCIELREIPDNSETARIIRSVSNGAPKFEERTMDPCPFISLPNSYQNYLQSLGPNWRRNLRRWERKAKQNYKVEFTICRDLEKVEEAMNLLFGLHQRRWQLKNGVGAFADSEFRDFHVDVAKSFLGKGWLVLNFLTFNDRPVAVGYAFKYAQKLFCYLSGFDPQYSEYHVGHIRHVCLIKYCIENGLKEYDFLRGSESYKNQWNPSIRKNLEVRSVKRKIIPVVYDWITRSNKLLPLTYWLGRRLSPG